MIDLNRFRDALINTDGTARDINFTPLTLADCCGVVKSIFSHAAEGSVFDGHGNAVSCDAEIFLSTGISTRSVHAELTNVSRTFTELQCFLCFDDDSPFLELTFFPEHVSHHNDALSEIVGFLSNIIRDTDVSEYFVRYQNESWRFGDSTPGSGVIFTRSQITQLVNGV